MTRNRWWTPEHRFPCSPVPCQACRETARRDSIEQSRRAYERKRALHALHGITWETVEWFTLEGGHRIEHTELRPFAVYRLPALPPPRTVVEDFARILDGG